MVEGYLVRHVRDLALRAVGLEFDNILGQFFQADLLGAHRRQVHTSGHAVNDARKIAVTRVTLRTDNVEPSPITVMFISFPFPLATRAAWVVKILLQ